jgi:hypothetical protein
MSVAPGMRPTREQPSADVAGGAEAVTSGETPCGRPRRFRRTRQFLVYRSAIPARPLLSQRRIRWRTIDTTLAPAPQRVTARIVPFRRPAA